MYKLNKTKKTKQIKKTRSCYVYIYSNNPQKLHVKYNNNMLCSNTAHYVFPIYVINKKTPEGVYAGRVGVSKNS